MEEVTKKRRCRKCNRRLSPNSFQRDGINRNGSTIRYSACRKCMVSYVREHTKKRFEKDPRLRLLFSSYCNAKTGGVQHSIGVDDIPLPPTCLYLGIQLDYRATSNGKKRRVQNGASIDRIDPTKGYVPGNIQIISDLANRMKQDATISQLVAFACGVLDAHGPR